jgi:hypothetical protein
MHQVGPSRDRVVAPLHAGTEVVLGLAVVGLIVAGILYARVGTCPPWTRVTSPSATPELGGHFNPGQGRRLKEMMLNQRLDLDHLGTVPMKKHYASLSVAGIVLVLEAIAIIGGMFCQSTTVASERHSTEGIVRIRSGS